MTLSGLGSFCRLLFAALIVLSAGGVAFAQRGAASGQVSPGSAALQAPGPMTQGQANPVPPADIPNVPQSAPGPTILAPGVFPPPLPPVPLSQPPSVAPQAAPALRPGEIALATAARFGRDAPQITSGLHWRVYADKPDQNGVFRVIKEDRSAQPTFALPRGGYVVHVSFGLAHAVKAVQLRGDAREIFDIAAGGLSLKGQVGDVRIPSGQIAFDIYKGSQFDPGDRRPIVSNVSTGELALLPEGTYYILSKYGDSNSVVRSDIRVQAGKLTDVTVTHRAAAIMFKLVSRKGGEALANTDWAVVSPAGDTITESKGAFPRVILAEGEYRVIAKNDDRVYQQDLKVITGVDGEIEVLAR
jgi:hypothetical protein